jgi:hypothetical protein
VFVANFRCPQLIIIIFVNSQKISSGVIQLYVQLENIAEQFFSEYGSNILILGCTSLILTAEGPKEPFKKIISYSCLQQLICVESKTASLSISKISFARASNKNVIFNAFFSCYN